MIGSKHIARAEGTVINPIRLCIMNNCGKEATRQPKFLIWAQGQKKQHPPATGLIDMPFCDTCKVDAEVESSVLGAFRDAAKKLGKAEPGYWEVEYILLSSPEAQEFQSDKLNFPK